MIHGLTDARLSHPWLRINRVLRVVLQTRWSTEAWSQVRVEFSRGRSRQDRNTTCANTSDTR